MTPASEEEAAQRQRSDPEPGVTTRNAQARKRLNQAETKRPIPLATGAFTKRLQLRPSPTVSPEAREEGQPLARFAARVQRGGQRRKLR
jgi:hypothetical protein